MESCFKRHSKNHHDVMYSNCMLYVEARFNKCFKKDEKLTLYSHNQNSLEFIHSSWSVI